MLKKGATFFFSFGMKFGTCWSLSGTHFCKRQVLLFTCVVV